MKFGVICVSDRCSQGICEDKSGKLIEEIVSALGETAAYMVVPDETAIPEGGYEVGQTDMVG